MRTYTAIRKHDRCSVRIRAASNVKACEAAANQFGMRVEFRVLQGGYGYDSGWQQWASIYNKVHRGIRETN